MTKPRILLVDDDAEILRIFLNYLRMHNFDAVGAGGGAEGIRLALENKFDLIISDMVMPDVDGVEFLTKLKEGKVQTRFIFLTGEATDLRSTVKFVKLGACDVIHKPIDRHTFISTIDRALALESPLALRATEQSQLMKNLLAEAERIEHERGKLLQEQTNVAKLKRSAQLRVVGVKLVFLAAATLATILFYRLGMIPSGTPMFALPVLLFILLSLPLERIKTLFAKTKKGEGGATFE